MTVLLLVLLLVLVALNGLFVAAEIGLVRSRKARLEVMAGEGAKGAGRALSQIDRMGEYIAACQVGITMTSIGIGFAGEPALSGVLEPVFGSFSHALAVTLAVAFAFLIVTSIHITFGELTPKFLAIAGAERTLRRLARPLDAFRMISGPFARALTKVAAAIVRLFGVRPADFERASPPTTSR